MTLSESCALHRGPAGRFTEVPLSPRLSAQWPQVVLVVVSIWALYLLTAPRTVVLEDDGLFILSAWFLGVEHPPGYPLFVLLGKLATFWPFGSPAWRVHALSGLFGALACGLLFLTARVLLPPRVPGAGPAAWLAALGLGASATFWSQAMIADVYTLHALLLLALLLLSLEVHRRALAGADLVRLPAVAALLTGLGLANHWPLLLLSAPGLAVLWWPAMGALWRRLPLMLLWLAVGLLPYLWMLWRSQMEPLVSFQGSIDSLRELIDYLLRRGYAGVDNNAATGADDKLRYLGLLVREAAAQLLLPGAALAVAGFAAQWRRWGISISAALTLAFVGPTLLLVLLLDFPYEPEHREAFRVYPTAAWGIFALWAGLGLLEVATRLGLDGAGPVRLGPARQRHVAAAATAVLLALVLAVNGLRNHRASDWLARDYAAAILSALPEHAMLLAEGDVHLPALAYLHHVEGLRPDVTLVSRDGLLLEPRLFDPYRTPPARQRDLLAAYVRNASRPVYGIPDYRRSAGSFTWLTHREPGAGDVRSAVDFAFPEAERRLLRRLLDAGPLRDGWSEILRRHLLERFASFQARAWFAGQWPDGDSRLDALVARALALPEAALARAAVLSERDPRGRAAEIRRLLARFAAELDGPWIGARHLGAYYSLVARTAQLNGQPDLAREALARYREVRPDGPSPVVPVSRGARDVAGPGRSGD